MALNSGHLQLKRIESKPRMLDANEVFKGHLQSIEIYKEEGIETGDILVEIHGSKILLPDCLLNKLRPLIGKVVGILHLDQDYLILEAQPCTL